MNIIGIGLSVANEYGARWIFNRGLYCLKLLGLRRFPVTEKIYERKIKIPRRVDLFQFEKEKLEVFLNSLPDNEKERIIKSADLACEGKILCFSGIELDYGIPINWQINPITGRECDVNRKWYEIPDFDEVTGDIKIIWEVSRFTHFICFARAYVVSKNIKYYEAFSIQLKNWIKHNPYPYGANYKCGQECSFRIANVLFTYSLFKRFGLITEDDTTNVKILVYRCYKKILSNFFYARKCIKNDHTFSELMGMILGAWCVKDEGKIDYAYKILNEEINRQFSDDGGYLGYSFNYEREILQTLECILALGRVLNRSISEESNQRLIKAVNLLYQCQDNASGFLPNYGSNDGALIFPLSSCKYRDYRPVINALSVLTTGKRMYGHGLYDEELLWFVGTIDQEISENEKKSGHYDSAGIYLLKNDNFFAFLVANKYKRRPGHMDQLHLDLWMDGRNVLCDSGTYSYIGEVGRQYAASTAHNTVSIAGKNQMNIFGHFLIYDWAYAVDTGSDENRFTGTICSGNGYKHKREVVLGPCDITVVDEIHAEIGDKFRISFHTPYKVESEGKRNVMIYDRERKVCGIQTSLACEIKECFISETYLSIKKANRLDVCGIMTEKKQIVITKITKEV